MTTINDGGPAFPRPMVAAAPGMTLRDWFATHATEQDLQAFRDPRPGGWNPTRWAARYLHADAMLKAREVKP